MSASPSSVDERLATLACRLAWTQFVAAVALLTAAVLSIAAWKSVRQVPDVVRARSIVIEDSRGRSVVVLGAPVPDPKGGRRRSPTTGMAINDTAGAERFGLGLSGDGSIVMGFDAPPGIDRGNTERITLSVSAKGGSEMRFLDHDGYVRAHMSLFSDNDVALFFTGRQGGKTIVHRVGATGDTVVVHNQ
jgi:hypothetical protein